MVSVSEKRRPSSRLLPLLIAFSIILLISSSLSLLEFTDNSLIPKSVLQFIIVKNASRERPVYQIEAPEKGKSADQADISEGSNPQLFPDEQEEYRVKSCDRSRALLRVYMYNLPPEFHFGLLGWKGNENQTWPVINGRNRIPSYPGGLNLQHSAEYWLTLDLLASESADVLRPCSAIRVRNPSEADVIFVPFFSSLSYNRHSKPQGKQKISIDRLLQEKLVEFLKSQKEWKRFGGKDHLILAHHPNSMLIARKKLGSAMFVLADFGRYPIEIANIEKDVIAPYRHMVRTVPTDNSPLFDERPTLVYFQGAIYRKDVSSFFGYYKHFLDFVFLVISFQVLQFPLGFYLG